MAKGCLLSVRELTVRYGPTVAVDGLSLDIAPEEIFGLLGPNGCGKSTTLAALSGDLAPAAGCIRLAGIGPTDHPLEYRRRIGLVPQELAFYEDLSGEANLLFFGRLYGMDGHLLRQRVAEVLEFVRLTELARRPARTYSGGMRRRLNVACALLHQPDLLLLDEPTVGLDLPSREAILDCLRSLRQRGAALLLTTHHLDEAQQLCDRIGILEQGRLIAQGTLAQLTALRPNQRRLRVDQPHDGLERVYRGLTGRWLGNP
jgi:ABC-2 type transport system ATP-binding protein